MAVFQIEFSDEKCEHIELRSDGTVRLFGRNNFDDDNGCFTMSARQLSVLLTMIEAQRKLEEAAK